MSEDQIDKKVIRIDELKTDTKKITIVSGKDKYSFWILKQNGEETKAYEGFKVSGLNVGDSVEVTYKTEDAEWVKDGKTIYFKRRTILGLQGTSESPDESPAPRRANYSPTGDFITRKEFEEKIGDIREAFLELAKKFKESQDNES